MGRKTLPRRQRREIMERLRHHVKRRHRDKRAAFVRALDVPHNTVAGWFNAKEPAIPDAAQLVEIARRERVNLNWLLLGEGGEIRGLVQETAAEEHDEPLADRLRSAVLVELSSSLQKEPSDIDEYVPPGTALLDFLVFELVDDVRHYLGEDEELLEEEAEEIAEKYVRQCRALAWARKSLWDRGAYYPQFRRQRRVLVLHESEFDLSHDLAEPEE